MAILTQEEKDRIRDESVAQWWEDWWKADYSWDGLTQKPWHGWLVVINRDTYDTYIKKHGLPAGCPNRACKVIPADHKDKIPQNAQIQPATLLDYWRDQYPNLIREPNSDRQWAPPFVPVEWKNGEKTWKNDPEAKQWEPLSQIIQDRINQGSRTEAEFSYFGAERITKQDNRAQLRGCVLANCPARATHITIGEQGTLHKTGKLDDETALHLNAGQIIFLRTQSFEHSIFGSTVNFHKAQFSHGDTFFSKAQFSGGSTFFKEALFSGGNVFFNEVQFSGGNIYFDKAQFSGGNIFFSKAQFSGGRTSFHNVVFSGGDIYFREAQFSVGDTYFGGAQFSGGYALFKGALFNTPVSFSHSQIYENFSFMGSQFKDRTFFFNTHFPESSAYSEGAFRGAIFEHQVDFSKAVRLPFNAFDDVEFLRKVILSDGGDAEAQLEFDRALKAVDFTCEEDKKKKNWARLEHHYGALERGCMTLKLVMERNSDKNRAQRYFKYELLARQKRPGIGFLTKKITSAYGITADYGSSLRRPLVSLIVCIFALAFIYGVDGAIIGAPSFVGPLEFSLTHTFRPFMVWSNLIFQGDGSWVSDYHKALSDGGWLTIKVLATLQAFFSITMLFLFGLAVKRKFQIK